jgi:hypothetical protein
MDFWSRPDVQKYLPLPTDPEAERAFATYLNYLVHLERCLQDEYGTGPSFIPGVISAVRRLPKVGKISRRAATTDDVGQLRKSWRIAWAKELQLRIPGTLGSDLLPYLVHGSGIHAYYVVFHSARALFTAAGEHVSPRHSATLSTLSSWVENRGVMPVLWSMRTEGGPDRSSMQVLGKPPHATTAGGVNPLSNPGTETVWDALDMFLCTTRERQIEERKKQWREQNDRKRVPTAEATNLARKIRPTTLFNMLFRLRRRSDYSDADAFLDGIPSGFAAEQYHSAMSTFVHATLTVLETLAVAYTGRDLYKAVADGFLKQASGPASDALAARRAAIGP